MDKTQKLTFDTFIAPTENNNFELIGMEFEYPLVAPEEGHYKEMGNRFLEQLVKEQGFTEEIRGSDGNLVRVDRDGDSISYDYHYSMMEISISPQKSLFAIAERREAYLGLAKEFYDKENTEILGRGNYPRPEETIEYTCDPFYSMIREFLAAVSPEAGIGRHFGNMYSVQTHLEVPKERLLKTYNLFNAVSFVRGMLISNSPAVRDGKKVYCSRDMDWEESGLVNAGLYDTVFESLEDLAYAISREMIFVTSDESGLGFRKPIALNEYFDEGGHPDSDIAFFRSFKHVVVNKYNCLEVREDCTQPMNEALVPAAFNLGLALAVDRAADILHEFKTACRITGTNSELRRRAILGESFGDEETVKKYLFALYDCAFEALKNRGFGEEELLKPLYGRIERMECPAKAALED